MACSLLLFFQVDKKLLFSPEFKPSRTSNVFILDLVIKDFGSSRSSGELETESSSSITYRCIPKPKLHITLKPLTSSGHKTCTSSIRKSFVCQVLHVKSFVFASSDQSILQLKNCPSFEPFSRASWNCSSVLVYWGDTYTVQDASHAIEVHYVEGPSSLLGFVVVRYDFGCW